MSVSHGSGTQRNPFGSRFLTCVAVAVAVSIGSAGFAAAAPGSGGGGGGGGGVGGGHPEHSGVGDSNGGSHSSSRYSDSAQSPGYSPQGYTVPGYTGLSDQTAAPRYAVPNYSAPAQPPARSTLPHDGPENNVAPAPSRSGPVITPPMVIVPPPGAGFTQWLGDGSLLWINPAPPAPPESSPNIAPNGNRGGCNGARPICSTG